MMASLLVGTEPNKWRGVDLEGWVLSSPNILSLHEVQKYKMSYILNLNFACK